MKQRRAEHPFGLVPLRPPQSVKSLSFPWNKDKLGIPSVVIPQLRLQDSSGDSGRFEGRLALESLAKLNAFATTSKGDISSQYSRQRIPKETWLQLHKTPLGIFQCMPPGKLLNYWLLWRQFYMNRPGKSLKYRRFGDNSVMIASQGDIRLKCQYNMQPWLHTETGDRNDVNLQHHKRLFGDMNHYQRLHSKTFDLYRQGYLGSVRNGVELRGKQDSSEIVHSQGLLERQSSLVTKNLVCTSEITIN